MSAIKVLVIGYGVCDARTGEAWETRVLELTRLPCRHENILLPDGWGSVEVYDVSHWPSGDPKGTDAVGAVAVRR